MVGLIMQRMGLVSVTVWIDSNGINPFKMSVIVGVYFIYVLNILRNNAVMYANIAALFARVTVLFARVALLFARVAT